MTMLTSSKAENIVTDSGWMINTMNKLLEKVSKLQNKIERLQQSDSQLRESVSSLIGTNARFRVHIEELEQKLKAYEQTSARCSIDVPEDYKPSCEF